MTDYLLRRIAFLAEITERKQKESGRLGKTAMQKLLYLLQEGYGVKLGYRFDLYTYGPYESAVMRDIDYMACTGLLDVRYEEDTGGYRIALGSKVDVLEDYREQIRQESSSGLDSLLKNFGSLNASELELRTTILYVVKDDPSATDDRILEITKSIKPKFDIEEIRKALDHLKFSKLDPRISTISSQRRRSKKSVA